MVGAIKVTTFGGYRALAAATSTGSDDCTYDVQSVRQFAIKETRHDLIGPSPNLVCLTDSIESSDGIAALSVTVTLSIANHRDRLTGGSLIWMMVVIRCRCCDRARCQLEPNAGFGAGEQAIRYVAFSFE